MSRLKMFTAAALAVASLAPAAAGAADNELRGAPQMRLVDANEATLSFTTDQRLTRTQSGSVNLRIQFVGEQRVSEIVSAGRHGGDYRYRARVTSDRELRLGKKYRVRFAFSGQEPVTRLVKVHPQRS